jgi:hypothetical protein
MLALCARNDLAGSSFAFQSFEDQWRNDGDTLIRTLVSVRLIDCAPCAIPVAYDASTVSLRSLAVQVDAPLSDVLDLAREGELRKLMMRTDFHSWDSYKPSDSPTARQTRRTRSGRQALITMLGMDGLPVQQVSLGRRYNQLTDMRYAPTPTTTPHAQKQLTDLMAPPPLVGGDQWD